MKELDINVDRYQEFCETTEAGPVKSWDHEKRLMYFCMGLAGETGETIDKIKKLVRDKGGKCHFEDQEAIATELGDICWYLSEVCSELDISLSDVMDRNYIKLTRRIQSGTIQGSGDNR